MSSGDNKMRKKATVRTPICTVLELTSALHAHVQGGLGAIEGNHRVYIDESVRKEFADSLALDEAMRSVHPDANRWDYLLGHAASKRVLGLEPHSAKEDQISTVIAKRKAALEQLRVHLKADARIAAWLWVASGKVHFADTERARRRLDQNGVQFVGTRVLRKHVLMNRAFE